MSKRGGVTQKVEPAVETDGELSAMLDVLGELNEHVLFHGTCSRAAKMIIEQGFDGKRKHTSVW